MSGFGKPFSNKRDRYRPIEENAQRDESYYLQNAYDPLYDSVQPNDDPVNNRYNNAGRVNINPSTGPASSERNNNKRQRHQYNGVNINYNCNDRNGSYQSRPNQTSSRLMVGRKNAPFNQERDLHDILETDYVFKLTELVHNRKAVFDFILSERCTPDWSSSERSNICFSDRVESVVRVKLSREDAVRQAVGSMLRAAKSDKNQTMTTERDGHQTDFIFGVGHYAARSPAESMFAIDRSKRFAARDAIRKLRATGRQLEIRARKHMAADVEEQTNKWSDIRCHERGRYSETFDHAKQLVANCDNGMLYGATLRIFGSTTAGLAVGDSDLDVCVLIPGLSSNKKFDVINTSASDDVGVGGGGAEERRHAVQRGQTDREMELLRERKLAVLRVLETQALQEEGVFQRVSLVTAKVPVLKFQDRKARIFVDITVGNGSSVLLSRLFRKHVDYDERVWFLCMFVKQWAKNRGVCGVFDGYINSMGWIIMVIYFLQHGAKPAVACSLEYVRVPKQRAEDEVEAEGDGSGAEVYEGFLNDDWAENWVLTEVPSSCMDKGGSRAKAHTLLLQFFKFFSTFDFERQVISLALDRPTKIFDLLGRNTNWQIFIEQPLKPKENIVKHVEVDSLRETIFELRRAVVVCEWEGDLERLMEKKHSN